MLAAPEDDALRLVLADHWMAEGDPRGELMRLEVELAAMDELEPERKAHQRRVAALLDGPDRERLLGLTGPLPRGIGLSTERGLPSALGGAPADLAQHGEALLARYPHLDTLGVSVPRAGSLAPLTASPLLTRARRLDLHSAWTKRLAGLTELPELPALRDLTLLGVALAPADLDLLLARAPGLEALAIVGSRLNKGALEPLGARRPDLVSVALPAAHTGPVLGALLGHLRRVRVASLPGNELGTTGLTQLLPALAGATYVDLRGNALGPDDVARLLDGLGAPRTLSLGQNAIGDAGAALLADWPGATSLVKLHLGGTGLTDAGARRLAESPRLAGLRSLVLSGVTLSADAEAALIASPHLAEARIFSGTRRLARPKLR